MGSYNFVSPGAMAGNAIEQFLIQRDQENRQRMLDDLTRRRTADDSERQTAMLALQQEQERRIASAQREAQANLETERGFRRATTIANAAMPDDPVDSETAALLRQHGYGSQIRQGQPTQGAHLGTDEAGVDQYDVIPGVLQMRGGSQWLNAEAQRAAAAANARAAAEAAAERSRDTNETRALIAGMRADGSGRGSDYSRYLERWARDRGITVRQMTGAQEEEARRHFYEASRDDRPSWDDEIFGPDAPPSAAPTPTAPRGGGAGGGVQARMASPADVRAVAQRANISETEAQQRLQAAGVMLLVPSH